MPLFGVRFIPATTQCHSAQPHILQRLRHTSCHPSLERSHLCIVQQLEGAVLARQCLGPYSLDWLSVTIGQHEVQRHPLWRDAIRLAGEKPETRPPSKVGFAVLALAVCVAAAFIGAVYWMMT